MGTHHSHTRRAAACCLLPAACRLLPAAERRRVAEARAEAGRGLRGVSLPTDAARLGSDAALDSVRHGRLDEERWNRLLRLCEAAPARLLATSYVPVDFRHARVRDTALRTARFPRTSGTAVAGRLALHLVGGAGRAADWDDRWRAETDPDTATEALLLDPDERC